MALPSDIKSFVQQQVAADMEKRSTLVVPDLPGKVPDAMLVGSLLTFGLGMIASILMASKSDK